MATVGYRIQIRNHVVTLCQLIKLIFIKEIFYRKMIYPVKRRDKGIVEDLRVGEN